MSKYSKFNKKDRDYYATIDPDAVKPLLPFVRGKTFYEPCVGDGSLVSLLEPDVIFVGGSDIKPVGSYVGIDSMSRNALNLTQDDLRGARYIITNPPYTWELFEPIINHLRNLAPTWVLLPADWMHNRRMGYLMKSCSKVVSIGRLYWFKNEKDRYVKAKENYAWYFFPKGGWDDETYFYGRS